MKNLQVFVSSKQSEFELERAMLKHEIETIPRLEADLAEDWSPERTSVRRVFLDRVISAHFYVGLFGCIYSEPTRAEYMEARMNQYREILIYVKACTDRQRELAALIAEIESNHVPKYFTKPEELLVMFRNHLLDALVRSVEQLNWLGKSAATRHATRSTQTRILAEAGLPTDLVAASSISKELTDFLSGQSSVSGA
jgi:hypothetical protein